MKALQTAINSYTTARRIAEELLEADNYNVAVRFDEFEVVEECCCDPEEYPYTDIEIAKQWVRDTYDRMVQEATNAGIEVNMPYADSIYFHRNNGVCISLRDHDLAASTWRHWDEIYAYDFNRSGNIDFSIL